MNNITPKTLFHYTDQLGVMGILSSRELWATNAAYLNDSQELVFAYRLFEEVLGARMSKVPSSSLLHRTAEYLIKHLESVSIISNIYVSCFSTKFDDLNQWRSYSGSGNGYMLGINSEVLSKISSTRQGWDLVECYYERTKQEGLILNLLDLFEIALDGVFPYFGPKEVNEGFADRVALAWASRFARSIAPAFKHPAFSEEKEWRLVHFVPQRFGSGAKFRSGRSAITPYMSFALESWYFDPRGNIARRIKNEDSPIEILSTLMLRPHIDADFVSDGFRAFADSVGLSSQLVTTSKLPYRTY